MVGDFNFVTIDISDKNSERVGILIVGLSGFRCEDLGFEIFFLSGGFVERAFVNRCFVSGKGVFGCSVFADGIVMGIGSRGFWK